MLFSSEQEATGAGNDYRLFLSPRQLVHAQTINIGGVDKEVVFSVIKDDEQLEAARDLINDRYGWRGYGSSHNIPSSAQHTTFTAEVDEVVVGTITLAIDSKAGLALDKTFSEELDQARRSGARVCELVRLAFDPALRSKEVMAGLFHLAFIYGTSVSDCTDLFIEVHPRHAVYYEAMLRFDRMGELKINASVNAPAQLMRLKVDLLIQSIREMAGQADAASRRSLYPYFFEATLESKIRRSLVVGQHRHELGFGQNAPAASTASSAACDVAAMAYPPMARPEIAFEPGLKALNRPRDAVRRAA